MASAGKRATAAARRNGRNNSSSNNSNNNNNKTGSNGRVLRRAASRSAAAMKTTRSRTFGATQTTSAGAGRSASEYVAQAAALSSHASPMEGAILRGDIGNVSGSGRTGDQHERAFTSLPLIDIEPLVTYMSGNTGEASARDAHPRLQQTCAELDRACRSCGFFYVTNHGIEEELLQSIRDMSRQFFALDESEKMRYKIGKNTNYRGYQELGDNVTRFVSDDGTEGFIRDWHEALDFYREVNASEMSNASPLHGVNPMIHLPENYSDDLRKYSKKMLDLSETIMRGLAIGLGLENEMEFIKEGVADETYWVMRVINYPPLETFQDDKAGENGDLCRSIGLSCGEHSDYGFLTLVNQDTDITALQVKNTDGIWVDAPPMSGALVCNIGNMLENLTAGAYKSTLHRVVHTSTAKSRISIPFFFEPNFDAVIQPLEECASSGDASAYVPVVYGQHLNSKILGNFELQE